MDASPGSGSPCRRRVFLAFYVLQALGVVAAAARVRSAASRCAGRPPRGAGRSSPATCPGNVFMFLGRGAGEPASRARGAARERRDGVRAGARLLRRARDARSALPLLGVPAGSDRPSACSASRVLLVAAASSRVRPPRRPRAARCSAASALGAVLGFGRVAGAALLLCRRLVRRRPRLLVAGASGHRGRRRLRCPP